MKLPTLRPFRLILWIIAAILTVFILIMAIMTIADYKPTKKLALKLTGDAGKIPSGKMDFSISTWNLGYFGLGEKMDFFYDGGKRVRPKKEEYYSYLNKGLDYISSLETVDFILFQELDRNSKRSYRLDQIQSIQERLCNHAGTFATNYKVWFVPVPINRPMGKVFGGIAEFTRYHPEENFRGALPGEYSWPVRIFMLDRCYIFSRYRLGSGKDLLIINTHNEAFDAGEMRRQQMELLRALMLEEFEKGNYIVAGGDWNMNPVGYEEQPFSTGDKTRKIMPDIEPGFFPEGWTWAFDPSVPTNRSVDEAYTRGKTPTSIIDFFITSPNIQVDEIKTFDLKFECSDHQPVIMKFQCR